MANPDNAPAQQAPLLKVEGLSYKYNQQLALDQLSLSLNTGEVLGLVGLNGAGKSTTLRLLCGLLAPSAGQVRIAGFSLIDQPAQARRQLGYLPDPPALHDCLSTREAIDINARLHGLSKTERKHAVARVLEQCQLEEVADKRIKVLSKGYRQRAGLAQALVHEPKVLVLDEPASGLDPAQTQHLNQLITHLSKDRAILFSSHAIADVQSCCTRVALLRDGRLIQDRRIDFDSPTDVTLYKLQLRERVDAKSLLALPCVSNVKALENNAWVIELKIDHADAVVSAVLANDWGLRAFGPHQDTMSTVLQQLQTRPDLEVA
ncbi:MAG: ABC transporter ATP-binding protein [Granulosicoccaceae bacterium]